MNKFLVSAFVSGFALTVAATPAAAQSDMAAAVQKGSGCFLSGGLVGVPGFLITTETIVVSNNGGNVQLTCHFDIPLGDEPAKTMKAEGFTCGIFDGTTFFITDDTRAQANPGGRALLSCQVKK